MVPAETRVVAESIEREVLARINPTAETQARVAAARTHLVEAAERAARERSLPVVRCLVAGSAARGTYLSDRLDIDLFLLFPPTYSRANLEAAGKAIGAAILTDPRTKYAEHPYLRGAFEGFQVDAVPGFAVDDPTRPLSAVDRTPYHQAYLSERQSPSMVEQVRLTKQFLRTLRVYGSEARTSGFSGYLVELLILRFGTLRGLLTAARSWRVPTRLISTPGASPTVPDDIGLILDDPVDPGRNVATALSRANLALFMLGAAEYLDRPTSAAFVPAIRPPPSIERGREWVARRGTHVAVVHLPRPELVDDILYPQLRKAERAVADEAHRLGFAVVGTASAAGSAAAVVLLEVEHAAVPAVRVQDGPPAGIDRVGSFLDKWTAVDAPVLQGPYVGPDGKLAVETLRAERHLEPLLRQAFDRLPIGRDLKAAASGPAKIETLGEARQTPELCDALGELLEKCLPWRSPPP